MASFAIGASILQSNCEGIAENTRPLGTSIAIGFASKLLELRRRFCAPDVATNRRHWVDTKCACSESESNGL